MTGARHQRQTGGVGDSRATRQITDPDDERLDPYRSLRATTAGSRRRERNLDHVVIEGRLAVERAMEGPLGLASVLVSERRLGQLGELLGALPDGVEVLSAAGELIEDVTGFDVHRGVLAVAPRPAPVDPAALLARSRRVVVLEGLNDLENTGSVFRTAAALGIDGVILDSACADPLYRRCVRVSLGWSTVLPHARIPPGTDPLALAAACGHRTVALTPHPDALDVATAAHEGLLADPVALVVGAEGPGLEASTIESADVRVSIPMARGVDSLNAATALAVVAAFAAAGRQWG